jgi:hypothetical protein
LPARRTFALIFGLVALLVTAGALVLAAYGPTTLPQGADAPPSGWSQVYNASLTTSDNQWDTSQGCQFASDGLEASADATCAFTPSTSGDLTSQGFQLAVTVAPAATVSAELAPFIQLGDQVYVGITQQGQYSICTVPTCSSIADPRVQGSTISWHGDAFVANTLTVRYLASAGQLTLFVNGQQAAQASVTLQSGTTLALSTPTGGEAVFTHATLFTASGS